MTNFVSRLRAAKNPFQKRDSARGTAPSVVVAALGAAATALLMTVAPVAHAQTTGDFPVNGAGIRFLFGVPPLANNDGTGTFVDMRGAIYTYIRNPYVGFINGVSGSFAVNDGANSALGTVTYNLPGRFSIMSTAGSLRTLLDDNTPLTGFNSINVGNFFNGVFITNPTASSGAATNAFYYDYNGYTTAVVDGTARNLGFNAGEITNGPRFVDNRLETTYDAGSNIQITQNIRLLRSTVRFEYRIRNLDTVAHAVILRLAMNVRESADIRNPSQDNSNIRNGGVFFVDPRVGRTNRPQLYTGGNIPNQLDILQYRAKPGEVTPAQVGFEELDYGFHARHILRGFEATPPDFAVVTDSDAFFPEAYSTPQQALNIEPVFTDGIATGLYWNLGGVAAGQERVIVTYYGNGAATEDLTSPDFVAATDATEALGFNTAAVTDPAVLASPRDDISKAALFYTPRPFNIFGSLYNRSVADLQGGVTLTGVSMSLNLPIGLQFGDVDTDATTITRDVSSKFVGNIPADRDAVRSWVVEPTGAAYGPLNYQLVVSIPNAGVSRTVNRTINIPAAPLRNVSNRGWQMISFPFEFNPTLSNNGDPYTVVNGIASQVDENVSFFRYDNIQTPPRYVRVSQLQTGVGYFYLPNITRTIFGQGLTPIAAQAPASGAESAFQIGLTRGWNMIGNPYVYSIPLNNLQFVLPGNLANAISFQDAVSQQLVRGAVFFRNAALTGYDILQRFDDPLLPWEGYYIFSNQDVIVRFSNPTTINSVVVGPVPNPDVDPIGGVTRKAQAGLISSRRVFVPNPTMDEWKLQLVARRQDGNEDGATFIGVSRNAKDGDDMRDLPKPGAPPSNYVYVGITRKDATTRFAQDLKAPGGGAKTWEFEFTSDKDGPVTLLWPNRATLPRRLRLRLTDQETNRAVDLRSASSVTLNAKAGVPHRFQVTASDAPSQPLAITDLRSLGAPLSGGTRGVASGYSFGFTVNQEATATVQVTTTSGKVVSTPFTGRATNAGQTRVRWDGRAQNGAVLPIGGYRVRVTVRSQDGEVKQRDLPIMTIR